jgi:hypothetical protein
MSFFLDLIATGKIRTKTELRSLYRQFIKRYHPDSRPERAKDVDFDDLKRDYLAAARRLDELAAERASPGPFIFDPETFMAELRDLVARGFPVSVKAVRKNKAYAASIEHVSLCVEHLYTKAISFSDLDTQIKFLHRRIPRVYYYALQVLWSCFDCANGHADAKAVASRHLGCISHLLREMGFSSLDRFLGDIIELSERLGAGNRRSP